MALERTVEFEGTTHTYSSEIEGDTFLDCAEWAATQSEEMMNAWEEFRVSGQQTDLTANIYNQWLVACKITHTIKKDGEITLCNNYKDLENLQVE